MRPALVLLLAAAALPAQTPLRFAENTIATGLKGGYQIVIADLNHDGKPDIIGLASGQPDLVWYENPSWTPHTLATGLPHLINCAAGDPGPDGIPTIVVAWEFANDASKSIGKVGILEHDGDPRQPWKLRQIDQRPTSHRLRWADIDGTGKKVAIAAPLTGLHAAPPDYTQDHAPLVLYRPGQWKSELIDDKNLGVQHGILIARWNPADTRDSILTASFSGLHLYQFQDNAWTRTELSKGDPSPCPKCGSSDVAIGYLAKRKFLAAIEPWHGNQVVVYTNDNGHWERHQIDDSLLDGHTILTADFDRDGRDEIVAGFRQGSKSLFLYRNVNGAWQKQTLDDGGMGAASCATADLDGDGSPDLACISATALKWYRNVR